MLVSLLFSFLLSCVRSRVGGGRAELVFSSEHSLGREGAVVESWGRGRGVVDGGGMVGSKGRNVLGSFLFVFGGGGKPWDGILKAGASENKSSLAYSWEHTRRRADTRTKEEERVAGEERVVVGASNPVSRCSFFGNEGSADFQLLERTF